MKTTSIPMVGTNDLGVRRQNRCRKTLSALLLALGGGLLSATASASLIFDSTVLLSAQGFGNVPRDLTIEHPAAVTNESGCVGVSGGAIVVGPTGCQTTDAAIDPNGVIPVGGDEPPPLADNQKYGIPTFGSLGIINASQIGILFNATEPGGDLINVIDITLNIFDSSGTFITSIDGQQSFANSDPGNGVAGFVFRVDATEAALLDATVFSDPNFASDILALNSSLTDVTGGPDTYRIVNLGSTTCTGDCTPVPEPATTALVGLGLIGLAAQRRRRKN